MMTNEEALEEVLIYTVENNTRAIPILPYPRKAVLCLIKHLRTTGHLPKEKTIAFLVSHRRSAKKAVHASS